MKLSNLRPPHGAKKRNKRVGRGSGSGHGKTSCRGHKGAGARSGTTRMIGFEGGQMPLIRRVPKRGFNSKFKVVYQVLNLDDLKRFKENAVVTVDLLKECGLIKGANVLVKILGDGEITRPLTVSAHAFSKSAAEKITKAGGRVEHIRAARGTRGEGRGARDEKNRPSS